MKTANRSLMALFQDQIAEFRRAQALGYPVAGLLSLIVMAMIELTPETVSETVLMARFAANSRKVIKSLGMTLPEAPRNGTAGQPPTAWIVVAKYAEPISGVRSIAD